MKVILTGVTGFIGHETLLQCLANTSITSIIVLSRRALPSSIPSNPKLKVIILSDFTNYSESIMSELSGAEACIW
jgi:nucleoside-diphosphate-sugar epimerase